MKLQTYRIPKNVVQFYWSLRCLLYLFVPIDKINFTELLNFMYIYSARSSEKVDI